MGTPQEVWMVTGTEPGTKRFGHLIQSLRKELELSVDSVAEAVDLSVGTVRAIEQGRRSPSEESGLRLLKHLLPPRSNLHTPEPNSGDPPWFEDPYTGRLISLVFGAKRRGDNRRWASDSNRATATAAEAALARVLEDPDWSHTLKQSLEPLQTELESLLQRAQQPPSDASLGSALRNVSQLSALRVLQLRSLTRMWLAVDSGKPTPRAKEVVEKVTNTLNELTYLDEEWL